MRYVGLIALIFVAILMVNGCGKKYSDETILVRYATFVEDKENVDDFLDAEETFDEDFLQQQILDGKVKYVDKETKISVMDEMKSGKVIEIKFLQGRYKNRIGYTRSSFVKDVKKERELAEKNAREKHEQEQARLEAEQKELKSRLDEEQSRLNQLVKESKNVFEQNGLQITCIMGNSTDAYWKIIGATNLPNSTSLTIELAGIKKGSLVQNNGQFTALFERSIVSVGEHNISIQVLDRDAQPTNVQLFDDNFIKEKGIGILGQEIYVAKISIH